MYDLIFFWIQAWSAARQERCSGDAEVEDAGVGVVTATGVGVVTGGGISTPAGRIPFTGAETAVLASAAAAAIAAGAGLTAAGRRRAAEAQGGTAPSTVDAGQAPTDPDDPAV